MKKFTKILSLVLAVTLVASLFTVNVMAASKARAITIKLYDSVEEATRKEITSAEVGDTVVVELTMDNTEGLTSVEYELLYEKDAFNADVAKTNRVENCINKAWLDGIKDTDGDWGYYLGAPTYNVGVAGSMKFQWAGSEAVEAEYAKDNRVIGLFILTVKDGAAGNYQFTLNNPAISKTMDAGENSTADMVANTATLKVGADAPTPSISTAEPTATEAGIAVERADGTKFTYDNCYTVTVSMTNANDATKAGMQFIPKKVYENADNTWTGYAEVEFAADGLGAGERAYTAALINIPRKLAGQNIDMMARGFMVVNGETLTGTVVESVVNYEVTPEPGQN